MPRKIDRPVCVMCGETRASKFGGGYKTKCRPCVRAFKRSKGILSPKLKLVDRFYRHVDRSAGKDGCWPWTGRCLGGRFSYGVSRIGAGAVKKLAHFASWEFAFGPVQDNFLVKHYCGSMSCVNPLHLFIEESREPRVARHVRCPLCRRLLRWINKSHLKSHRITSREFLRLYPGHRIIAPDISKTRAARCSEIAGVSNKTRVRTDASRRRVGISVSKALSKNRRRRMTFTAPHRELYRLLREAGLARGFRNERRVGRYVADIANRDIGLVIELQGCFWHGCQSCYPAPSKWQLHKIAKDALKRDTLVAQGWTVFYVWQCELRDTPQGVVNKIRDSIRCLQGKGKCSVVTLEK